MTKSPTNHIIKYADDTTVIGLIHNNEEDTYREEMKLWCRSKDLVLNVVKLKRW